MKLGLNLAAHHRVFSLFAMMGLAFGGIFTRIGDIQLAIGVGQTAIGGALIGTAAGMIFAASTLSARLEDIGFRNIAIAGPPLMALTTAFASLSPNPIVLFFCLFLLGLLAGMTAPMVNVEADRTELMMGRRIMNRCHSIYSVGFLATAMLGAAARQVGITPFKHLLAIAICLLILTISMWWRFTPAPARPQVSQSKAPLFAIPTAGILLIGLFTIAAMIYEGAAADWSAIYMRDVFAVVPLIGGLALVFSSTAQAFTRFFSDGFVERYGPVRVAQIMLLVLGAGALAVAVTNVWVIALFGFALMGAGNAVIMPLAVSAAAARTDRPAAINVASLTQLSWVAFFAGPPLIGMVAEHVHVRLTFGAALPLIAISFALAPLVLREKTAAKAVAS